VVADTEPDTDIGAIGAIGAAAETDNQVPSRPGTLVKLRDNEPPVAAGSATKKVRRKRTTRPPPDEETTATWDPNALFPDK